MGPHLRFLVVAALACLPVMFLACSSSSPGGAPDAGGTGHDGSVGTDGGGGADAKGDASKDGGGDAPKGKPVEAGAPEAGADGSSGDGSSGDASPEAGTCTITLSGSASGTYPCTAGIVYSPTGNLTGTWLSVAPSVQGTGTTGLSVELSSSESLSTGTYDQTSAVSADSAYTNSSGGAWLLCFDTPGSCGNQGTFTVDVQSAGTMITASNGAAWVNAFGTATASLPPAPNDPLASGTVFVTIQWATTQFVDGGAPDAGGDAGDGGSLSNKCSLTLSGGTAGTQPCTTSATYASAVGLSFVTISAPGDGGVTSSFSFDIPGALQGVTYSSAAANITGASGTVIVPSDGGSSEWVQSYSSLPDASAPMGTFSLGITTPGVQVNNPAGWSYVGTHGSYSGTLVPSGGAGTPVTAQVTF